MIESAWKEGETLVGLGLMGAGLLDWANPDSVVDGWMGCREKGDLPMGGRNTWEDHRTGVMLERGSSL